MKIHEIIKLIAEKELLLKGLRNHFRKEESVLLDEISRLIDLQNIALKDINIDHVQVAEKLLRVSGEPWSNVDGRVIIDSAAEDIANGCNHLNKKYFGNKRYEGFYQSCDSEYGYGPKHGSIVDRISLIDNNIELTPSQKDSCIYYLKNYKKIAESRKDNK